MPQIDVVIKKGHTILVEKSLENKYREWNYCEQKWYLEGKKGLMGEIRALFFPTKSAISKDVFASPMWERLKDQNISRWTFTLSEESFEKMVKHLKKETGDAIRQFPGWHRGKRSYHLFHNCHHFVARALKVANIPTNTLLVFNWNLMQHELDKVQREDNFITSKIRVLAPIKIWIEDRLPLAK